MTTVVRNSCPTCRGPLEPGWLWAGLVPELPTCGEAGLCSASQERIVETARQLRAEATRLCIVAALKYETYLGAASVAVSAPAIADQRPPDRVPESSPEQQQRIQERRDLALLLYYPNEEAHLRARDAALTRIREAMRAADPDSEVQLQRALALTNSTYDAQRIRLQKLWPAARASDTPAE